MDTTMPMNAKKNTAFENLKKFSVGFKEFLIIVFILLFIAAFSYWAYELWYIHSTNIDLNSVSSIAAAAAHEEAAFQACVLAFFFVFFLIYAL